MMLVCRNWRRILQPSVQHYQAMVEMARNECGPKFYKLIGQTLTFEDILRESDDDDLKENCLVIIALGGGNSDPASWTRRRTWCFLRSNHYPGVKNP